MTNSERNRHALIDDMERLYLDRAWSDQEMAERVGTDRTNVWKIRTQVMEAKMGIPFLTENGRHRIDRTAYVANIRLTPAEALSLYLGGRRLQQHTKTGQQDVAAALEKLANALHKPLIAKMIRAAEQILDQEQDPQQTKNLRVLMEAWVNGRCVRIKHRKPHGELRTYTVSPYQLEPSVWGDGIYLIGYSDYHNGVASFKLSRIEHITQTMQPIVGQTGYDSHTMLRHAWGIWSSDKAPQTVRLKFTPFVTPYVRETVWHPEQTIQDLPDGGCIWQADIAEWREMLPWVRGWGSDVEVLAPEEMREEVIAHIRRCTKMYDLSENRTGAENRLLLLWGKTTANPNVYHPALFHMLDVAHVAQQLLSSRATPRWRQVLARTLNTDANTLHEWLPYLIALHDIGKLSPPFQVQNTPQQTRLASEGFDFGRRGQQQHHTVIGRLLLNDLTANWPPGLRHAFLDMVSGHHGVYKPEGMQDQADFNFIREPGEWAALRQHAIQLLESYLCRQWPDPLPEPDNISAAIAALNGFCILCDWLGSDGNYFAPKPTTPLAEYVPYSRQQALARVKDAGLFQTAVSHAPTTFTRLFHDFNAPPRPLQLAIEQIPAAHLANPTLTIIEAPTGEGKTEAALLLARRIAAHHGTDEMYIALPTTATSNAMYKRITVHLHQRLGLNAGVQLIHGQSFLKEDDIEVNPLLNTENEEPAAENWFAPKKKALLAPFGVGTIDQAELSALNVRHNALRLIGLAGKTVILDEVHAYDTYMTTIIKRMLSWLAALGSSVILLSATLPKAKRREMVAAFAPQVDPVSVDLDVYPSLLTITPDAIYTPTEPIAVYQQGKTIHTMPLHFTEDQAQEKANWLLDQVKDGGCACWITNTVDRAQAIFQALSASSDVDLTLLHGRFPLARRQIIEADILQKYGKPGEEVERPQRGIVIGTQVLEQSLDLDFDLMVTDLAPIDLILQRAGRLHRHQRPLAQRHAHTQPRLYINMERAGADQYIYSDYILRMTERALHGRTAFSLPADYRPLIEDVYTEAKPDKADSELYEAWDKLDAKAFDLENEANLRLAAEPLPDQPFYLNARLQGFTEDEDGVAWTVAQTRWSERETIAVIPLVAEEDTATIAGDEEKTAVSLTAKATRAQQLHLLRHSLRLSRPDLVQAIKAANAGQRPRLFESALLKNTYPLWLAPVDGETAVFVNDTERLDQPVCLHPELGLVFGQSEKRV